MDETVLISRLESPDSTGLRSLFSDHLAPFADLANPKKSKPKDDRKTLARSLAKNFLPFLNRALAALPRRLADPASGDRSAIELFEVYRLCLDCLESVASELSGKPYAVHFQRIRMVRCLEAWGRWKDAEAECFEVLEKLKEAVGSGRLGRSLLPDVEKCGGDSEIGGLVAEIVVSLVKCVSMSQSKDVGDYRRVIQLVEEFKCWFRVLDANTYEKLHRILVAYVGRCAVFLVGDAMVEDKDLTREFCIMTITEYSKSSTRDQIYKVAGRICSSLFTKEDSRSTFVINILKCVLDSLAHEEKVELENSGIEFVELISYCSNKCLANADFCSNIGAHLNKIADNQVKTHFQLIVRLYAMGLLIVNKKLKANRSDNSSSGGVVKTLCTGDVLPNLAALLHSLHSYSDKGSNKNCVSFEKQRNGKAYDLIYVNALKFMCVPLAEIVSSEKKLIIAETEAAVSIKLCHVQEAFYQFYDAYFFVKSSPSKAEKDGFAETNIPGIAVALLIVSLGAKINIQKSVRLLKDVISSNWIQLNGLKNLFTSLYNIAVILYREGQLREALKALKLSCISSWCYVKHLSEMFLHTQDGSNDDLSEDTIVNFVNESCTRSSFLLNSLHQCDHKVKKIIIEILEHWSVAADLFIKLPGPLALVKQWVKIECKRNKDMDSEETASSLYSFLLPSDKVSKRSIGIILEQELHLYKEASAQHPELSQKMEMKIIGHLLEDVYVTQENWLQRSKILVQKGRVLRFYGHCLNDCIQCLSEAISLLEAICGGTCNCGTQPGHLLAVAYCLRAFCTQEAEPNAKQVFQDIKIALQWWLSIATPDFLSAEENCSSWSEMMILLYNIADLLSLKGCMDFHCDVYRLMFRLFEWKNFPLEKSLAALWKCRRLSHGLCISPVDEAFLTSFADHYDGLGNSVDSWLNCLKGSEALRVGFEHNFSFLFANFPRGSLISEISISNITSEEVKHAAFQLISNDPATGLSIFVAGYLFYDLSERLISNGLTTEALMYAKEAHRLRSKLFGEKFKFSVEKQPETPNDITDALQKVTCNIQHLQVRRTVANQLWSADTLSWDLENCYLSPWIILQCYLESTLQVGVACDLIGDGAEAEALFIWGKSISCLQNLPLFVATFSSVLGNLYCKKQLWDLAEKELHNASQHLETKRAEISCSKCRLILEVTVEQHLGDVAHGIINNSDECKSIERSSRAEAMYKSALDKLNHSEWKICDSIPEAPCPGRVVLEKSPEQNVECGTSKFGTDTGENKKPCRTKPKENQEINKARMTRSSAKSVLKDQDPIPANNLRTTRSKNRSQIKSNSSEALGANLENMHVSDKTDKSSKNGFVLEGTSTCNKMRCWCCLRKEVMKQGSLNNFVDLRWEFFRRKQFLRLLTGLGNCFESCGQLHEAHEIFLDNILILVNQDSMHLTTSAIGGRLLLDLIGKESLVDTLNVERAELLYSLSWLSLKNRHFKGTSEVSCCDVSNVQLPQLVAWLKQSFTLCAEVPTLFQKVSRLLAVIFLLAGSGELSLSSSCKALSENHWASFFHQASVGTHLNYRFFSNHDRISEVKHAGDSEGSYSTGSTCLGAEIRTFPRLAPESVQDLEEFVRNFFAGLPGTTAICISLLGDSYAYLLQEILQYTLHIHAWLLVSRLDSHGQPIVLLLPAKSILESLDDDPISDVSYGSKGKHLGKQWQCPWGSTMVDSVAPEFRLVLEENYLSSSIFPSDDTPENRRLWWTWRRRLDSRLGKFLRNLEDSWLGHWKYILLGQSSNHKSLESVVKKLARSLKIKCKIDVSESLLNIFLGAPKHALEDKEFILLLWLRKGCYVGRTEWCDKDRSDPSNEVDSLGKLSGSALQLLQEAVDTLEDEVCVDREPTILVLDFDVQMLPWENMPILRNQEVYRMPSIWSVCTSLDNFHNNQDQSRTFPCIDPMDTFYLLNPGGDLCSTQDTFENWFMDKNFEGKAGYVPTSEELAVALRNHDLFLYFGHGSGAQYIPGHKIQKLENCAATLLMGCSSGSLMLNGCYAPHGTPLCYLIAGSPVIVANLWEVTDKDIDRFGKAVIDAWLKERLNSSSGCAQCSLVAKELEALSLKGGCKGNAKKKIASKAMVESCEVESVTTNCCDHRPKIGSFMGPAREACTLRYLIGAAPVCYGVPTGIRMKKDLKLKHDTK